MLPFAFLNSLAESTATSAPVSNLKQTFVRRRVSPSQCRTSMVYRHTIFFCLIIIGDYIYLHISLNCINPQTCLTFLYFINTPPHALGSTDYPQISHNSHHFVSNLIEAELCSVSSGQIVRTTSSFAHAMSTFPPVFATKLVLDKACFILAASF